MLGGCVRALIPPALSYLLGRALTKVPAPEPAAPEPVPTAAPQASIASFPPMRGAGLHSPPATPGTPESALAWAEAVAAAGCQLNTEGFEEQATFLLLAAGELDAIGHGTPL